MSSVCKRKVVKEMMLSKYERETVIIYNEEESTATISTLSPVMMRRLKKLAEQSEEVKIEEVPGGGIKCVVPKKYVSVRKPKKLKLSKEQTERMAEAMRERRRMLSAKGET